MQLTASFTETNGDISREMLGKNNTPRRVVLGILISLQRACGGFAKEGFGVAVQANLRKVSICDTEQDLEGKQGAGGGCSAGTRLHNTVAACLMTLCIRRMLPHNRQRYVNIYLFIALLSDSSTPLHEYGGRCGWW